MRTHSKTTRLLSLFVVAFICLNAGGAVCVAYCRSFTPVTAKAEHCPLKKTDSHCGKKSGVESRSNAIADDEIYCCSVTVGFLPAPIEKSYRFSPAVSLVAIVETPSFELNFISVPGFTSAFDYRGPPPLDRRFERIKQRLLRI